jgi:hypothetical protein
MPFSPTGARPSQALMRFHIACRTFFLLAGFPVWAVTVNRTVAMGSLSNFYAFVC